MSSISDCEAFNIDGRYELPGGARQRESCVRSAANSGNSGCDCTLMQHKSAAIADARANLRWKTERDSRRKRASRSATRGLPIIRTAICIAGSKMRAEARPVRGRRWRSTQPLQNCNAISVVRRVNQSYTHFLIGSLPTRGESTPRRAALEIASAAGRCPSVSRRIVATT
jgi:hypothetical protein